MMHHSNASLNSLNDKNLYEISIGVRSQKMLPKKKYPGQMPRRVGLASSLATLNESKRPGEYYIQKLSQSSLNLPKLGTAKRPPSGASLASDVSKDSDDVSLVGSSQFDCPDSRHSSMTSNSLYSNRISQTPTALNTADSEFVEVNDENSSDEDLDQMSSSISTITLKTETATLSKKHSATDLAPSINRTGLPKLRAASTSNILAQKQMGPGPTAPTHALQRTTSVSSSFLLTRTKTRYFNPKETKERQQLRKKVYEDNDDDDEILFNDLDLVFNVPVIKNHPEIYMSRKNSSSSILSRKDIVNADDSKYYSYNGPVNMKPCPLPGKVSSTLTLDTSLCSMPEDRAIDPHDSQEELSFSSNNDSEITLNISEFYNQRSVSYSKLVKMTREQQMVYKLPTYIKSQTSIEDISLISPEKLEVVDQSRPINLPPKSASDKFKHSKEFHRVLSSYELNTKSQSETRKKLGESFISNQQNWFKLMITVNDDKEFARKLAYEKNALRKLNWESLISEKLRFDYFMKVLTLNLGGDFPKQAHETLLKLEVKYDSLSEQMKATKNNEFDMIINNVIRRPVYNTFLEEVAANDAAEFDVDLFKKNYRHMLYIKSLSDGGLKKHHEIFLIPMFLILFQSQESASSIYILIEMFDSNIFGLEVFADLNKYLGRWQDLSRMSSSSVPYKVLSKFNNLSEFEYLSSMSFFEILLQLNDKLPLSLSAPCTPIVAQGSFAALTCAKHSAEFESSAEGSTATNSLDSLPELSMTSVFSKSSSLSLIGIFLQLLVIYSSSSKSKTQNYMKLYQGFLLTIFKYYHINWNSYGELVKSNKSIKLNNTSDQLCNLESFLDKWRELFKKM